jgi:hypothetical protein
MKIAKVMIALLVVLLPLMAQKEKTEESKGTEVLPQNWPVKMFQVKYADVGRLANLFRAFGATVQPDSDLRALSVRAPKEVLAAIEESLQRLDVAQPPAKNIEIDAYLLTASQQGITGSIPPDLDPVVKQFKSIFSYHNFRLLGTLALRGRDGSSGSVNGVLPAVSADSAGSTLYFFEMKSATIVSDSKERSIRINDLALRLNFAIKEGHNFDAHIHTSIDVHEGQKVVVGKANIDNADNALILVLTAKVIE